MAIKTGEDQVVAALLAELPAATRADGVHTGAGLDDCAIVRPARGKTWQLLKTDSVIEGVHFLPDAAPEQVGWKALCRPLSDIAATGGEPDYAMITIAMGPAATLVWATAVYVGIARAAREFGVCVVGGETASTPGPSFLSVCVTGTVKCERCVTRGGGRPGDLLYVTGTLGGSLASGRHLTFRPRLEQARWLTKHFRLRAMMDLSDGLAADLPRLARASQTGYVLDRTRVPASSGCTVEQALSDGEDYELLFALSQRQAVRLERMWPSFSPELPLTNVGRLAERGIASGLEHAAGYDHFAIPAPPR